MKKNKIASTQSEKCFVRKREMYTLAEKKELGEYKEKYDKKLKLKKVKLTMITNELLL